jgi:hypothetical protein
MAVACKVKDKHATRAKFIAYFMYFCKAESRPKVVRHKERKNTEEQRKENRNEERDGTNKGGQERQK